MSDRGKILFSLGAFAIAALIVAGLAFRAGRETVAVVGSATPTPSSSLVTTAPSNARTPAPSPSSTVASSAAPSLTPTSTPKPTAAPPADADPRLRYAAFLIRINDDRAEVTSLNVALEAAVRAQDFPATRSAAARILHFVDVERDWLRDHPPAACYQAAHTSARSMLTAYGKAAHAYVAWTNAAAGIERLAAFANALTATGTAGDALTAFGTALEQATCLT